MPDSTAQRPLSPSEGEFKRPCRRQHGALAGAARLLLCTDALTAQADEGEIAGVLSAFADPDQAAAELVRPASRNGGADNTAVVVDISP